MSIQKHLETVLYEFLEKKDRVSKKLALYDEQQEDMRERFIDQTTVELTMKENGESLQSINKIYDRKIKNQEIEINTKKWKQEQFLNLMEGVDEIQVHARELRKMSLNDQKPIYLPPHLLKGVEVSDFESKNGQRYYKLNIDEKKESRLETYVTINNGRWKISKNIIFKEKSLGGGKEE